MFGLDTAQLSKYSTRSLPKVRNLRGASSMKPKAVNIVEHQGIVSIFDFGQRPDGSLYIVMEYLRGRTLGVSACGPSARTGDRASARSAGAAEQRAATAHQKESFIGT